MASKRQDNKIWFFDVTNPELHPNGFTIYRVTCKVFPINSPESLTEIVTWKRYNDFKQLFKAMFSLHRALHRRDKFPEFAKPKIFGRFDDSVIEERRQSALRLLKFIGEQAHLSNSLVLQKFLEGGKKLPVSTFPVNTRHSSAPNKLDLLSSANTSTSSNPPDIVPIVDTSDLHNVSIQQLPTQRQQSADNSDLITSSTNNTSDVESKALEGTWNYPQLPDNISLGSSTSEDTDLDSTFGTPLKECDLSLFDPIKRDNVDMGDDANWLISPFGNIIITDEDGKTERCETLTKDSSNTTGSSQTLSVTESRESLIDETKHGHGDNDFDLGEFDPLRERSVSSIECGKGDIDLSGSYRSSSISINSHNSQISLPSSPKSGQSTPRHHSPANKKRSNTQSSVSSLTQTKGDYLVVAASQIGLAQKCEVSGNHEMAFAYYKIGVDVLIQGVQGDTDKYRQDAVRRKTAQYLMRAEEIYNNYLSKESLDDFRWAASSCISPNLDLDPSFAMIRGSVSELRNYKVLGVIDKVMLVMDKMSDETFIIKCVHKSSAVLQQKQCVLPTSCPYMCNLMKFFETENGVYLLLQYASGGKLWNYIGSYLHGRSHSGFDDGQAYIAENESKNIYTGCQLMKDSENVAEILQTESTKNDNPKKDDDSIVKDNLETKVTLITKDKPIVFSNLKEKDPLEDTNVTEELSKPRKRLSSFSSAELTFDAEGEHVTKSVGSEDQFDEVLNNNSQSLQYFTINSFDSNELYQRMDSNTSTTSDHTGIQVIPEESSNSDEKTSSTTSPNQTTDTNTDDVFHYEKHCEELDANEIIRSSKALIKSVDKVLSDSDFANGNEKRSTSLSPESVVNVSQDSDEPSEPSIYDIHKPSDDSSETSEVIDSKTVDTNQDESAVDINKPCEIGGSQTDCDKSRTDTVIEAVVSQPDDTSDSKIPKDCPAVQTGRKRTLSRMNSKTLTRSASFECDLKSPTKNRARAMSNLFDQLDSVEPEQVKILESCIRQWAAEIVVAVSKLHHVGIICRDLHPDNILLGDHGHIMLTYFCRLPQVDDVIKPDAADELYVAPEVLSVHGYDETCDWWSLGALLYELLVGQTLLTCHPDKINSHTNLYIPSHVTPEAKGLLEELLRHNPKERLGSSIDGVEAIKSHPFFADIDWNGIEGVY